jgi:hypothetical protein
MLRYFCVYAIYASVSDLWPLLQRYAENELNISCGSGCTSRSKKKTLRIRFIYHMVLRKVNCTIPVKDCHRNIQSKWDPAIFHIYLIVLYYYIRILLFIIVIISMVPIL